MFRQLLSAIDRGEGRRVVRSARLSQYPSDRQSHLRVYHTQKGKGPEGHRWVGSVRLSDDLVLHVVLILQEAQEVDVLNQSMARQ